jgi:hypothetical protein
VRVTVGTTDVSRDVEVKRVFGSTKLRVEYADGTTLTECASSMCWMPSKCKARGLEHVTAIRVGVVQTRSCVGSQEAIAKLLKTLGRHSRVRVQRVLGGMTYVAVRQLYGKCRTIKHELRRKLAEQNIKRHAMVIWGVSIDYRPVLRVESTSQCVMQAAVTAARAVMDRLDVPLALKRDLRKRLRPVRVKPQSIARILCNWRPECAKFDPDEEPVCVCGEFPAAYRQWGSYKGHFVFKSDKYRGPGEAAMHVSNRTVVEHEQSCLDRSRVVKTAIQDFVRGLPERLRESVDDCDVKLALGMQAVRRKLQSAATAPRAEQLGEAVEQVRVQLRGAVISEIDKERGKMLVM